MKSAQIRSFFWSVFFRIWKISLRIHPNAGKYGLQKTLYFWQFLRSESDKIKIEVSVFMRALNFLSLCLFMYSQEIFQYICFITWMFLKNYLPFTLRSYTEFHFLKFLFLFLLICKGGKRLSKSWLRVRCDVIKFSFFSVCLVWHPFETHLFSLCFHIFHNLLKEEKIPYQKKKIVQHPWINVSKCLRPMNNFFTFVGGKILSHEHLVQCWNF